MMRRIREAAPMLGIPTTSGITNDQRDRWRREHRAELNRIMVERCQMVKRAMRSIGVRARVSPGEPHGIGDPATVIVEILDV